MVVDQDADRRHQEDIRDIALARAAQTAAESALTDRTSQLSERLASANARTTELERAHFANATEISAARQARDEAQRELASMTSARDAVAAERDSALRRAQHSDKLDERLRLAVDEIASLEDALAAVKTTEGAAARALDDYRNDAELELSSLRSETIRHQKRAEDLEVDLAAVLGANEKEVDSLRSELGRLQAEAGRKEELREQLRALQFELGSMS